MLAEEGKQQITFTPFDPLNGQRGKPLTVDIEPAVIPLWDLSPDGTRIAFGTRSRHEARIQILPLDVRRREIS